MQINLNILTENNHSSLLSKSVSTADNALLQYMQKVTQGTNNADTEDKKQHTEAKVLKAIDAASSGRTVLSISHRRGAHDGRIIKL